MGKHRRWIPVIVFWALFLLSIGLNERHPWIDGVWHLSLLAFLVIVGVCALLDIFRHCKQRSGFVGYRGVPRWVVRLFGDDSR